MTTLFVNEKNHPTRHAIHFHDFFKDCIHLQTVSRPERRVWEVPKANRKCCSNCQHSRLTTPFRPLGWTLAANIGDRAPRLDSLPPLAKPSPPDTSLARELHGAQLIGLGTPDWVNLESQPPNNEVWSGAMNSEFALKVNTGYVRIC